MNTSIADQPAFPTDNEGQTGPNTWHHPGMSLRQYYAGLAIRGLLSNHEVYKDAKLTAPNMDERIKEPHLIASFAVSAADALIAELEKKEAA